MESSRTLIPTWKWILVAIGKSQISVMKVCKSNVLKSNFSTNISTGHVYLQNEVCPGVQSNHYKAGLLHLISHLRKLVPIFSLLMTLMIRLGSDPFVPIQLVLVPTRELHLKNVLGKPVLNPFKKIFEFGLYRWEPKTREQIREWGSSLRLHELHQTVQLTGPRRLSQQDHS